MTELAYARGDDRLSMLHAPVNPEPLLYHWRNTDTATRGISELSCAVRNGQLYVSAVGTGPDGRTDWGEVPATLYMDLTITGGGRATVDPVDNGSPTAHYADVSSTDTGPAFTATFEHGFMRVHLQARINLGLLVVAIYTEFTDDSGRSSYFTRDCYFR